MDLYSKKQENCSSSPIFYSKNSQNFVFLRKFKLISARVASAFAGWVGAWKYNCLKVIFFSHDKK